MNEQIRNTVRQAIIDSGQSQAEFARGLNYSVANFSRVLSGKGALLPDIWVRTLDALGYELTIVKKKTEGEG